MKKINFNNDILPLKNVLYRLALRITLNHEDAQDIVQDTLIKIWNKRETWQQIENIEAFALTITRNLALDKLKRKGEDNVPIDPSTPVHTYLSTSASPPTPYEQAMQQDKLSIVRNIINQLPEKQRSCMQLRDIEGKTYHEITQILGITEEQVKVNIFRARQTVKTKFQEAEEYGL